MAEYKLEQAQAVFHDQGNVLVSASAGSGKTFVMIERLIRLISEGKAGVKEILAVTFTEMAASEMKEKLKVALMKKISEEGDSRLIRELQEISTADISTLHAFCARLIRSYFFAVGVAPDFKILDEAQSGTLKDESVNKAFRELYEEGEEWFKSLITRHQDNRSDESLKKIIVRMSEAGRVNADSKIYLKKAQELYTESGLANLLKEHKAELDKKVNRLTGGLERARKIFSAEQKAKVIEFIDELSSALNGFLASEDIYVARQFEGFKLDLPRGLRFTGELKEIYSGLSAIRDEFKEIIKSANVGLKDKESDLEILSGQREHILGLYKIIDRYERIYQTAKREENGLDFADLEHYALDVLADENICREVKARYKYIFVDEYQDTNGAQEEIISRLESDNLFMVGDAKQSIYGFRGCRPEIFLDKLENMAKLGQKTVLLNNNFRSSDKVIELVNKVFSYSMTKEYFGMDYSATSMLQAGGVFEAGAEGRVELHLVKNPPRKTKELENPRIYDILAELNSPTGGEVLPTPALISSIIEDELKKEYYDAKAKKMRPVTYGDICVLTRNKDNKYVRDIVKTLVASEIPVVSVVKENVCDHPEIRQLIDAVKLIDCFSQDIPLAGVLKSPIGNFTDEELAQIVIKFNDDKLSGGFYDAFTHYIEVADTPLSARLKEFSDYFASIRTIADFTGAYGALKRMVADKNVEQTLFAMPNGRLRVKRLNRFISAGLDGGNPLSVKEFLTRVENQPSSFGLSDGAEENSVKVMTIHASKGLEFPVVIVCGLERHANDREEREEIMFDQDLGFAVKSYNDSERTVRETPMRAVLRSRMRDNRLKEELRLFYVALTRASYSLHLTFSGSKDGRNKTFTGAKRFLDYVPIDLELTEHSVEDFNPRLDGGVKTVLIGQPDEAIASKMKNDFAFSYPHLSDTTLPLKNSVTKAAHILTEDTPLTHVLFGGETNPERGNLAHKIMEYYDFSSNLSFLEQVDGLVNRGIARSEELEIIDLERLEKAVGSPIFKSLNGKTLYREKDFIVSAKASAVFDTESDESVLLQGVIDLLAVGEEGAVIIDYKYSSLTKESLKHRYSKQLELYAYALEKATGIKTQSKILVNLFTGDVITL